MIEISFDTNELVPAVSVLKRMVLQNEEFSMLSSIVFETINRANYNVIVRSNNVEMGIQVRINGKTHEEGTFSMNSDIFYDLTKNLDNLYLNVKVKDKSNDLVLRGTHYNAMTSCYETTENFFFDIFPEPEDLEFVSVDKRKFVIAMEKTIYSVSHDDNYYNMTGIYFLPKNRNSELIAVSMDGFRLSYVKLKYLVKNDKNKIFYNKSTVISKKAAIEMIAFSRVKFSSNLTYFEVAIAKNCLIAKNCNAYLFIKTIDVEYPDYLNLITVEVKRSILLKKNTILTSVKRVSSLSKEKKCSILFEFRNKKVTLIHYDMGLSKRGEISEAIDIEFELNITVLINTRYLLECLSTFDSEYIYLKVTDEYSPLIFSNEDNTHVCLVMPIKGD